MKKLNLVGQRFGRLTVISRTDNKNNKAMWICLCSCGNKTIVNSGHLVSGNTKSCGCLNEENKFIHGHTQKGKESRTHSIWKNMLSRCNNPKSSSYKNYGGRDKPITVCKRWSNKKTGFINFLEDMGEPSTKKHQIDRIDNNKGYYKLNSRWSTPKENCRNRKNNILVFVDRKPYLLIELAEKYGINKYTLKYRIMAGWPIKKALELPTGKYKKRNKK